MMLCIYFQLNSYMMLHGNYVLTEIEFTYLTCSEALENINS